MINPQKIGWLSTAEDPMSSLGRDPSNHKDDGLIYAEPWVIGSPYPTNVGVATIRLEALQIFNAIGGFMASCSYKVSWGWLDWLDKLQKVGTARKKWSQRSAIGAIGVVFTKCQWLKHHAWIRSAQVWEVTDLVGERSTSLAAENPGESSIPHVIH